jgi:two-component system, chemotaxis family, sensor kinase CheA
MDPKLLLETFLTESDELINELEQGLVTLEDSPGDSEAINQIFRSAHTLKSTAGMVSVDAIVRLAHVAESVLSRVRDRELPIDHDLITVLLGAVDRFKSMLSEVAQGVKVVLDAPTQASLDSLQKYVGPQQHAEPQGTILFSNPAPQLRILRIEMAFAPDLFATGQDPSFLIADLADVADIISVDPVLDELPEFSALSPERCYIGWRIVLRTERPQSEIEGVFVFLAPSNRIKITDITRHNSHIDGLADKRLGELLLDEGCVHERDIAIALQQQKRIGEVLIDLGAVQATTVERVLNTQRVARQVRRSTSIRVDTDKLDRLVNLVGELAVTISQVNQSTRDHNATPAARIATVEALEQIGRDLQTQVMSVRMVAIEETFGRFKRVARDLAQELGKHVVLETFGNETELDKTVSEQLADPLKHMVRNAIGHGLETPEERIALGKGDTGRIQLRAAQRQGHVIIEIADDGRGIDPERVLAKARRLGLVSDQDKLTERQIYDLLFQPGFSTADQVGEISGRGVGLDVVKRNVANLRGQIEVESQLGRGTTFRIKLPLTLAIIEGMNVRVGSDTMTIPLSSVVELLSPRSSRISTLEGKGELVDVRGAFLPVVRLSEVLECAIQDAQASDPIIVVVENDGRRFGILVDRVLGMDQAVVKPLQKAFGVVSSLDHSYRKVEAVSGATILGDGNIALILDVPGIERMAFGQVQ